MIKDLERTFKLKSDLTSTILYTFLIVMFIIFCFGFIFEELGESLASAFHVCS